MTGGVLNVRPVHRRNWKQSHGDIIISMIAGVKIDPPMRLTGDSSIEEDCGYCTTLFGLKPDTLVVFLPPDYIFVEGELRKKYRVFCCDEHADKWEAHTIKNQEKLREMYFPLDK